jgi:hypothetical protein
MKLCLTLVLFLVAAATPAAAQSKEKADEMGTPEQRAACAPDVRRFCRSVKPEEGPFAYLSCLQEHQEKLRPACVRVIGGGQP